MRWRDALEEPRLERAIDVVYLPETKRLSHYFLARLPDQFDGILHYDETRAVEPLERIGWLGSGRAARDVPHRPLGLTDAPSLMTDSQG